MNIQVERIIPIRKGNLQAFASITLGAMRINSLRIIQQPNQSAWVSLPQSEKVGEDGQKSYFPIIQIPKEMQDQIQKVVLEEWQRGQNGF